MVVNKRFQCIYTYFGCQQEVSLYLYILWLSTRGFTVSKHVLVINKRFHCIYTYCMAVNKRFHCVTYLVANKRFQCIYTYFGCQQDVSLYLNIFWLSTKDFTVSIHSVAVNKRYSLYLNIFWLSTRGFTVSTVFHYTYFGCQQDVSLYLNIFWLSTKGFTVSIHIVAVNKRYHCI